MKVIFLRPTTHISILPPDENPKQETADPDKGVKDGFLSRVVARIPRGNFPAKVVVALAFTLCSLLIILVRRRYRATPQISTFHL